MKAKCSQCHSIKIVQNHHIVAKADGGDNETTFLCRGCHLRLHIRNGDFRRWTSTWHTYFKQTDPKGYREHQRKAGRARQAQLRRLLGKDGYRQHQRQIALKRWNGRD